MIINTHTYNVDSIQANTVRYVGPGHTFSMLNQCDLSRVYPKSGKNGDQGVARPEARFERTVVTNATTGVTKPAILRVSGSLPVGMSEAEILSLLAEAAAFAASQAGQNLFTKLDING